MTDMTPEKATALRKPFPKESIGKLPKGGVQLDYVGHAAVTDRLLTVDPEWSWEPFALTPEGLPALDRAGNLWIRLTVCGVTRVGVGDGKSAKECIGDAIRNAAMRFGVALDLWAKEDLVEFAQAAQSHRADPEREARQEARRETRQAAGKAEPQDTGEAITEHTRKRLFAMLGKAPGIGSDEAMHKAFLADTIPGRAVDESRSTLTEAQAKVAIARLEAWQNDQPGAAWSPFGGAA